MTSTRNIELPDPEWLRQKRNSMNGLEFFRSLAQSDRAQVPLYEVIGLRVTDIEPGFSRFECLAGPHQCNPIGIIHGGVAATLLDSALGVAVQSTLEQGLIPATIQLHVDYLRAATVDTGLLVCEGRLVKPGKQIGIAEGVVKGPGEDGPIYARGHATFAISQRAGDTAEAPPVDCPMTPLELSWTDPTELANATRRMSGLECFNAVLKGLVPPPPIADVMDFQMSEISEGKVTFSCVPSTRHFNPMGTIHGGLAATLIDSATGCAVHSTLPKGRGFTTVYLTTEYFKAITADTGKVEARAHVVRRGSRFAVADADLVDANGILYARGTATCLMFDF